MPRPYFKSSLSQFLQMPSTFKSSLLAGVASGDDSYCIISQEAPACNQLHSLHLKTQFLTTPNIKTYFKIICLQLSGLLKLPSETNHLREHEPVSLPGENWPFEKDR